MDVRMFLGKSERERERLSESIFLVASIVHGAMLMKVRTCQCTCSFFPFSSLRLSFSSVRTLSFGSGSRGMFARAPCRWKSGKREEMSDCCLSLSYISILIIFYFQARLVWTKGQQLRLTRFSSSLEYVKRG